MISVQHDEKNIFWKLGIQNQIQTEQNITNMIEEFFSKKVKLVFPIGF